MGASKRKKQHFLSQHPICCFCGGNSLATTIDHVPSRACFIGRAYPETFEFPACDKCQNASRLDEIVFSHAVVMFEFNRENTNKDMIKRAIEGLINNLPKAYWPNPYSDGSTKRRSLRNFGLRRPSGIFSKDLPIVSLPQPFQKSVLRYGRKIAVALFYREIGEIAPADYHVIATCNQAIDPSARAFLEQLKSIMPSETVGSRINLKFGDRFGYRFYKSEDKRSAAFLAQFGKGLILSACVSDPTVVDIDPKHKDMTVAKLFDGALFSSS